jgi:hypothetical protein
MNDLYNGNYKVPKKEVGEDIKKWKDIPCSWTRKSSTVEISILPKSSYRFNFYQNTNEILHRNRKKIALKFGWNHKRPHRAKVVLGRKKKAGSITIPGFKPPHKAVVTSWHDRSINTDT